MSWRQDRQARHLLHLTRVAVYLLFSGDVNRETQVATRLLQNTGLIPTNHSSHISTFLIIATKLCRIPGPTFVLLRSIFPAPKVSQDRHFYSMSAKTIFTEIVAARRTRHLLEVAHYEFFPSADGSMSP